MPAIGSRIDSNQEQAFEKTFGILLSSMQTGNMSLHGFASTGWAVGIQFADESVSIILRRGCKLGDERFDQIAAGIFERFRAAEIGGVGLHERWIEIVLTNQQAQLVTQSRLAVA